MNNLVLDSENAPLLRNFSERKKTCSQCFRQEINCSNFNFNFTQPDRFYKSQWGLPRLYFLGFRLFLCGYTMAVLFLTITTDLPNRSINFTTLSYVVLCTSELVSLAVAALRFTDGEGRVFRRDTYPLRDASQSESEATIPIYMKLQWLLVDLAFSLSLLTTLHSSLNITSDAAPTFLRLNTRFLQSIAVVLDIAVSAIPSRLLHLIYPTVLSGLYFLCVHILAANWGLEVGADYAVFLWLFVGPSAGHGVAWALVKCRGIVARYFGCVTDRDVGLWDGEDEYEAVVSF